MTLQGINMFFRISLVAVLLLASPFTLAAEAVIKPNLYSTANKERLVLMPLRVEKDMESMLGAMETALTQGLQEQYVVFSGEVVEKKSREIFAEESAKIHCDEIRCLQDIGTAFQAELIAVANINKIEGGYLLALSIRNVMDNKAVFNNSLTCEGCTVFQVVNQLKELRGAVQTHALPTVIWDAGSQLKDLNSSVQTEDLPVVNSRLKVAADLNNNRYSAKFINGTLNGKIANSSYLDWNLSLITALDGGYFIELVGGPGFGKHDLYQPAPDQTFKRSSGAVLFGMSSATNPSNRYFLSIRSGTTQLAAFGQAWAQDTFITRVIGSGVDFQLPVSADVLGLNLEGGICWATWEDDVGYSATASLSFCGRAKASYSHYFTPSVGMTLNAAMQSYDYNFGSFSVKETVNSFGIGVVAKY